MTTELTLMQFHVCSFLLFDTKSQTYKSDPKMAKRHKITSFLIIKWNEEYAGRDCQAFGFITKTSYGTGKMYLLHIFPELHKFMTLLL
jgi:hypothetical protein